MPNIVEQHILDNEANKVLESDDDEGNDVPTTPNPDYCLTMETMEPLNIGNQVTFIDAKQSKYYSSENKCLTENIKAKLCVRFTENKNHVFHIPTRNSYSIEEINKMWWNGPELQHMIWRNTLEYHYELGNWKTAVEEENFFMYHGIKTHPVHVPATLIAATHFHRQQLLKTCIDTALSISTSISSDSMIH
jgi:hypothetical protein